LSQRKAYSECDCGFAVYTAVLARRKVADAGPQANKAARNLGKASYMTSAFGIVTAVALAAIICLVQITLVSRRFVKFSGVEYY